MSQDKAERRGDELLAAQFSGVPVYINYRLQPFFDENPMSLTVSGFGPLKDVKLAPNHAFADFVAELMQQVWDSPYGAR